MKKYPKLWTSHRALFSPSPENGKSMAQLQTYRDMAVHLNWQAAYSCFRMAQSPDLNQLENFWQDLNIAVHRHSPSNQTKLELFCKEEWANISVSICASLAETYPKRLAAVIAAKGGSKKYWLNKTMYHFPSTSQLCTTLCWSIT